MISPLWTKDKIMSCVRNTHLTLGGICMLTHSLLLMLLLERWRGTDIWAVATELALSESDACFLS
jgi:hypothetical protein